MMTCTSDRSGKASRGVLATEYTPHALSIKVASSTRKRLVMDQRIRRAIMAWSLALLGHGGGGGARAPAGAQVPGATVGSTAACHRHPCRTQSSPGPPLPDGGAARP